MTKQEAIDILSADFGINIWQTPKGYDEADFYNAYDIAIECIEKCIEIGSCKECKSADFCYDHPDVCFCLQHDHTMYADDTCNYFYRDRGDNDD